MSKVFYTPESEHDTKALAMLELLERILTPYPVEPSSRPLLISLDLEYNSSTKVIRQVGLAILDTESLSLRFQGGTGPTAQPGPGSGSLLTITSRLILLTQHRLPRNHCTRQYLFGTSESGMSQDLSGLITRVLTPIDKLSGSCRDVILIEHNMAADIRIIKTCCNLNIQSLPAVKAVIDTVAMPTLLFNLPRRQMSLKETCRILQLKARHLHNAGNDAMYTMQALLLLFCQYMIGSKLSIHCHDDGNGQKQQQQLLQQSWIHRLDQLEHLARNISYGPRSPKKIRVIQGKDHISNIMDSDTTDTGIADIFEECHDT